MSEDKDSSLNTQRHVNNSKQTEPGLRFKNWAMVIHPAQLLAGSLGWISSVSTRNAWNNVKTRMCNGPFPEDRLVIATSFLRGRFAIVLFTSLSASTTKRWGKHWDCLGNVFQHQNTSTYSGESMVFALLFYLSSIS